VGIKRVSGYPGDGVGGLDVALKGSSSAACSPMGQEGCAQKTYYIRHKLDIALRIGEPPAFRK
jgi:hypothetical protein